MKKNTTQPAAANDLFPQRIICLTEEFTEILYLLGEQHRIAGISVYTMRPPEARNEKPMVCDFTGVNMEKIRQINPDLILGFSDVQAEAAKQLIKEGFHVAVFNQRTIEEILQVILLTGSMVGRTKEAQALISRIRTKLTQTAKRNQGQQRARPLVYFEEWYNPLISGIKWVSELIDIAGGKDCFEELADSKAARGRMISNEAEVIRRNPDIIIASWCGKRFIPSRIYERTGWNGIHAIQNQEVHDIDSTLILQPGPAALTDGLDKLEAIISAWKQKNNP